MRLRLGISACLLGERVRYDGADKDCRALLAEALGEVTWVAVCPEVEVGMGVPREPVDLIGAPPRLVGRSGEDWTARMAAWADARLDALEPLDGFVLKARSPSCGLEVPVYADVARERHTSSAGLFAAAVCARWPALPRIDEVDLARAEARVPFLAAAHRRAERRNKPFPTQEL